MASSSSSEWFGDDEFKYNMADTRKGDGQVIVELESRLELP